MLVRVGTKTGIPAETLMAATVENGSIKERLQLNELCQSFSNREKIYVYELPERSADALLTEVRFFCFSMFGSIE